MARGFDDIFNLEDLNDDELTRLVREQLDEYDTIDSDSILVRAEEGTVVLSGRIGTEEERRIAERIVSDVLGIERYRNDLVVDSIRRDEEPEAIDDHLATGPDPEGMQLGRQRLQHTDESEHLGESLDARMYGTHDLQEAIEQGTAWEPPDSPTPEGLSGMDGDLGNKGEDH